MRYKNVVTQRVLCQSLVMEDNNSVAVRDVNCAYIRNGSRRLSTTILSTVSVFFCSSILLLLEYMSGGGGQ